MMKLSHRKSEIHQLKLSYVSYTYIQNGLLLLMLILFLQWNGGVVLVVPVLPLHFAPIIYMGVLSLMKVRLPGKRGTKRRRPILQRGNLIRKIRETLTNKGVHQCVGGRCKFHVKRYNHFRTNCCDRQTSCWELPSSTFLRLDKGMLRACILL